jgi:hypothetical protein
VPDSATSISVVGNDSAPIQVSTGAQSANISGAKQSVEITFDSSTSATR